MEQNKFTFDQLPQLVAGMAKELEDLKFAVLSMQREQMSAQKGKQTSEASPYPHVLCDVARAMEITHKSKSTIYQLVRSGAMPGMKRGKKLYFYEDELVRWIESGRKAAPTPMSHEERWHSMQAQVHHKPKSRF